MLLFFCAENQRRYIIIDRGTGTVAPKVNSPFSRTENNWEQMESLDSAYPTVWCVEFYSIYDPVFPERCVP